MFEIIRNATTYVAHASAKSPGAPEVRLLEEQDRRRHHPRGARDRQADEVAAVRDPGQHVEPRQPERAADHVEERRARAHAAERLERPRVEQEAGRDPEGDDVGERVELHAELGGGAGQPGHLPVEHVEHHADEERQRGPLVPAVEGQHDRVEPAQEVPRRQEPGQEEDRLPPPLAQLGPAPPPKRRGPPPHGSTPMTVSPPRTRSPGLHPQPDRGRHDQVRARAELDQAEPLAGGELVARADPAHDAARQDARRSAGRRRAPPPPGSRCSCARSARRPRAGRRPSWRPGGTPRPRPARRGASG